LLLLEASNVAADIIRESLLDYPENGAMHDPDVYLLNYLPIETRLEVEKPFIVGFSNYIETIAYLLKQGQLPRPSMMNSCVSFVPGTDKGASVYFASKGGLPEYVLDAILDASREGNMSQSELEKLPECANDDQWDYLKEILLSGSSVWPCGPYSILGEDDNPDDEGWVFYDTSNWKPPAQY